MLVDFLEAVRQEFEQHYRNDYQALAHNGTEYENPVIQRRWEHYQTIYLTGLVSALERLHNNKEPTETTE